MSHRPASACGSDPHAFLDGLAPSTIRFGLDRMRAADAALGSPWRAFRSLHVAGTNGKGSTCAFAEAIFRAAGKRVGFYSSPHLERVNERIRIDGADVSDDELAAGIDAICRAYPRVTDADEGLTYFEFLTALAFERFRARGVEVAVVEVGLGGRLDATNIIEPAACAITSIAFDHTEYLGTTLAQIAGEKAGILKAGAPFVMASLDPEAESAIRARADHVGARWVHPEPFDLEGCSLRMGARTIENIELGLEGAHQLSNAKLAALSSQLVVETSDDSIRTGLASPRWPGRLEQVDDVLLDGAHNPEGARSLANALRQRGGKWHAVFGALRDKDIAGVLASLGPVMASMELVSPASPRALPPSDYEGLLKPYALPVRSHVSVPEAIGRARAETRLTSGRVVVCGSLYLVGEARGLLTREANPQLPR